MRVVLGTICLLIAASLALAVPTPAPILGGGIATTAILGGVLLVSRLFKRD